MENAVLRPDLAYSGLMIYQFEQFELDRACFELRESGVAHTLEPQVFALLAYLVEHRDRLVSKHELFEKLWDGRVVTDSALTSRIKSARKAIGDNGTEQRLIKTVHGKGYRFVGKVHLFSHKRKEKHDQVTPDSYVASDVAIETSQRPSIAVLPFANLAEDTSFSTLANGLAHEVIAELARLRWLLVIARSSSFQLRDADLDMSDVGQLLGVRYCLCGTVQGNGNNLTVTTELIDTRTSEVIWGDQYSSDVNDIQAVRSEIKSKILTSLEIQIPLHEAAGARLVSTENLDAWSAYHLGLQHLYRFNRADNKTAAELFGIAIDRDKNFSRAYAGLSFLHFQTAFMRQTDNLPREIRLARDCAQRGLDIDPLDPFANFTMGRSYWLEPDLDQARSWLERATALSPNYAQGMYALAWTNTIAGEAQDGRDQLDLAMRLSPLDPLYYAMLGARGFTHIAEGEYEEAVIWADQAARSPGAHVFMALLAAITQQLADNTERATAWANDVRNRGPNITSEDFFRGYPVKAEPMRSDIARALDTLAF